MEPVRLVPLPSPGRAQPAIRIDGDRLTVDRLVLVDAHLASFVSERPEQDRQALFERALRIGLTALQDAGVSLDVDVVRREFEGLLRQAEASSERAGAALDLVLRQNFADGDGRLPRTLEKFLGDRGQLRTFVTDLFDETRRDSAMGRMKTMLGGYFDGDASRLAQLLDPTRLGSPLHQFRTEVSAGFDHLNDRLTAMEAAGAARAGERSKSSAKGADFEDLVGALLGDVCRGTGDAIDRTGDETGDVIRSRKGDFLLTIDPALSRGADLRVVIECKDRTISGKQMRDELAEAKRNRAAQVGLVVFTPSHAPAGIAPFRRPAGRRLLRHRPGGARPGSAGRGRPARPTAWHRDPRGAGAGGGYGRHRRRHHRRAQPDGRHPGTQDAADVDRHGIPRGERGARPAARGGPGVASQTWSGRCGSPGRPPFRQPADRAGVSRRAWTPAIARS